MRKGHDQPYRDVSKDQREYSKVGETSTAEENKVRERKNQNKPKNTTSQFFFFLKQSKYKVLKLTILDLYICVCIYTFNFPNYYLSKPSIAYIDGYNMLWVVNLTV